MKPIAMTALLLFCSALALAQQNHTTIYMYDANAIPGVSYTSYIDGVTIPVLQSNADYNCTICGTSVSCACTSLTSCAATPTSPYTWPDSGTPSFGAWTKSTVTCGSTLRGVASPCTVNLNFKSVTNGGPNSWAPQYIFTQTWANIAAQQNTWQPNHDYTELHLCWQCRYLLQFDRNEHSRECNCNLIDHCYRYPDRGSGE